MRVAQCGWRPLEGWTGASDPLPEAQLAFVFGERALLDDPQVVAQLRERWPAAHLFGATTAGTIAGTSVEDGAVIVTAVQFDHTRLAHAAVPLVDARDSYAAGAFLAKCLPHEKLVHVLVFADGCEVNGSELVRGLLHEIPSEVAITGGLAADGARFQRTLVLGGREARAGHVAAIGLYGERLRVGYGSLGGWDPSGNARRITRSSGHIVHEIDGEPALDVYERLLGPLAEELPASGLLYPLMLRRPEGDIVRTLLSVDRQKRTLTFAGDVPSGTTAYFMKADFDRLVEGAATAARDSRLVVEARPPHLALLVSCVGRRMVLKERVAEELKAVQDVLGGAATLAGFYSYGEICPVARNVNCTLHNQTMTITTIGET